MDEYQKEEHWRQLAELLGLPPEMPTTKPSPKEPVAPPAAKVVEDTPPFVLPAVVTPPVPPPPTPPAAEVMEPRSMSAPVEPTIEAALETVVVVDEFEEFVPEDSEPEEAQPGEETEAQGPEEVGGEGEEGKPRRGRRRRRRGRRRGGADKVEGGDLPKKAVGEPAGPVEEGTQEKAAPQTPRPAREPNREPRDARPPRGRHRDRDELAPPVHNRTDPDDRWEREEQPLEEVEDVVPAAPAAEEDDDVDILSDWDVPYWHELVASLYRPDR